MTRLVQEASGRPGWLRRVHGAGIDTLLIGTLVAGCAGALYFTVPLLARWPTLLWAALLTAGVVALGRWLRDAPDTRLDKIALALVAGGLLLRLAYVLSVDLPPVGDFLNMWQFALHFAESPTLVRPQNLEHLRAMPFLVPMAMLGNGSVLAYQVGNCVALALASWMAYHVARRHLGAVAAVLGLAITTMVPELTLATEIASHDIPGTLFLVGALGLLDVLDRSSGPGTAAGRLIGIAVLLGVVLWLLDLQRGLAPFVLGAALLTSLRTRQLPGWRPAARRALVMVALPVMTMTIGTRVFDAALGVSTGPLKERHRWFWMAAYANSTSSGAFADLARLWPALAEMSTAEVRDLALARMKTDFAERPVARIPNYLRRTARLHELGSQLFFYVPARPAEGANASHKVDQLVRRVAPPVSAGTRAFFLAALLLGLMRLMTHRDPEAADPPLITCALLVAALGLLGEWQPRYLMPYWVLLAPVAALPFVRLPAWGDTRVGIGNRVTAAVALGGIVAVLVLGLSRIVNQAYDYKEGRILPIHTGQVVGSGVVRPSHVVRLPADSVETGLDLKGWPATGVIIIIATADRVPGGCGARIESRGPSLLLSGRLHEAGGHRLRLALPADSLLVRADAGGEPRCAVEIGLARLSPG